MNLASALLIYAGGQGSGPNAPCPQCGPHSKHASAGDTVVLKAPVIMYNQLSGDNVTVPSGTRATVVHVLPKVGTSDQMVSVNVKDHDPEHVPMHSLEVVQTRNEDDLPGWTKQYTRNMHVPGNKFLNITPVPKSQTIMHTTTADGAKVTWIKPKEESEPSPKSLKELSTTPHRLKGDFQLLNTVPAGQLNNPGLNRTVRVYDTKGLPTPYVQGKGSTVFVSALTNRGKISGITVKEQNYTTHGELLGTITFDYKNAAKAVGMLKSRYGISTSLNSLRKRIR